MINLMHGDCLELMKDIPDGSVDLVLTDPPYGTIKGMSTGRWKGKTEWDTALNTSAMFLECHRVLRHNGACVLFSQEPYTSQLINSTINNLPFSYRMVWKKDHFANALLAKKAPVSYYEDILLFHNRYENKSDHPLADYFIDELEKSEKTSKDICKHLKTTHASHFFTRGRQFRVPNEKYLTDLQMFTGRFNISYDEIKKIHDEYLTSLRDKNPSTFNLTEGVKYKSNVLEYKKDYDGLHPTQKPVALMEDLIFTYSNEGETVLDFTMGSGTTGVACKNLNRKFIGIEKDDKYFEIAKERIENHVAPLL